MLLIHSSITPRFIPICTARDLREMSTATCDGSCDLPANILLARQDPIEDLA